MRLRSGLVVAQVAISIVLLVGSGLVARSLFRLTTVDLGFSPERVLTGRIAIQPTDYRERPRRQAFFSTVLHEIAALPNVRSVGGVTTLPMVDAGYYRRTLAADHPLARGEPGQPTLVRQVSAGYFTTMGMLLLRGRGIRETDRNGTPAVAVISESLTRRLFADRDPVGRTVMIMTDRESTELRFTVVGVVRNARLSDPRVDGDAAMYVSVLQASPLSMRIVVRTAGDAARVAGPIREVVRRHDRNALLSDVTTMDAIVDAASGDLRNVVRYLGLFAAIALLLAAVGLYGALAYHVSQQEHEIGVRLAIGATRAGILALVIRRGARLVVVGLVLGVAAAYPGTRLVRSLLFEIVPLDPATYGGAVLVLCLVAAAACLVPALRAARVDPAVALRSE